MGASIATVLTEVSSTILFFYFLQKYVCKLSITATVYKPVLASLPMGLLIFALRKLNIFLVIPLAIFTYVIFIWWLRYFNDSDIQLFSRVFGLRRKRVTA
jgi:hypothetical protein